MKDCSVENEATGKNSVLHKKLLDIFKDEARANLIYSKVKGEDFKRIFGDWVGKYNGTSTEKTGEVSEYGEPKLFNKKNSNKWYFKALDGTKIPVNSIAPLRTAFLPIEIREISKFFLFGYVQAGGIKAFKNEDTGKTEVKLLASIENSIKSYKNKLSLLKEKNTNPDTLKKIGILQKRIEKVEEYKHEFKSELVYELDALGQRYKERVFDAEGNLESEISEENKLGGLNIAESITVNSKQSATINTKIFLSQLQSKKLNKQRTGLVNKKSTYLKTETFEDFNTVWETLQPLLSDTVTTGNVKGDVVSSYSKMREKIELLKPVAPWAEDLASKLDAMYNGGGNERFKVYEFVQAFNKSKVNYYVTEFNAANNAYSVLNATSTNSRESQILDRWGYRFKEKWLNGNQSYLTKENVLKIKSIESEVKSLKKEFKERYGLAGKKDRNEQRLVFEDIVPRLFQELRNLGVFGLKDEDINALIMLGGGVDNEFKTVNDTFRSIEYMIEKEILGTTKEKKEDGTWKVTPKPFMKEGTFVNPFRSESMIKLVAKAAAMRELDIAESSILASGGKTYFAYSNPTYISNKVAEWKADSSELVELASDPINSSSRWLKYLLGYEDGEIVGEEDETDKSKKLRLEKSQKRLDKLEVGLASSFTSKGKDDGVDNVDISLGDQLNDNITKVLGSKTGIGTYFPTIIAADKSRRIEFKGFEFVDSKIVSKDAKGKMIIPLRTVDIFVKYFESEYSRMKNVAQEIKSIDDKDKVHHYHTGRQNGTKSQLFPEFNFETAPQELKEALYDPKTGLPIESSLSGFTDAQKSIVRKEVEMSLRKKLRDTYVAVKDLNESGGLNSKLVSYYKNRGGIEAMSADYMVNGMISSIEYTKVFSGDPAFYKDLPDLIKRIPSTYTDGLQLTLESNDDMNFNLAVVQGVEVPSKYIQAIKDSLNDKTIIDAYGARYDSNGKKVKGTSDVNTTDAQAWITPGRWKFLKKRLGQWSSLHDNVYLKMMNGKVLSDEEMKVAAQPLKGVYFEINKGVPTYLKYSQAVIIPAMVKNTPMQRLYDKMTKDSDGNLLEESKQVHEVVTLDGVKVGAFAPTKINKGNTTELADSFELNTHTISNKGWKLQQDLPIKTMHETNIGTQIQKNILEGLELNKKYKVFGREEKVDGKVLLQMVHDAVSDLIVIGREEVSKRLDIKDGKITDKDALYDALIQEFRDRGGNENIIEALEKGTPIEGLPQIKERVDSILMSIFNKSITKIATEGGSYIQVSPFALETILSKEEVDENLADIELKYLEEKYGKEEAISYFTKVKSVSEEDVLEIKKLQDPYRNSSNIKVISDNYDGKGLKPPRRGPDGQTIPGQVLIPHTMAMKLVRSSEKYKEKGNQILSEMTEKDWKKLFSDPKTRELVGYRIPNQGMSSNDTLEIVGVLPSTMGDSIIGYDGIPAKTGSDFDIDKMYVMAPNMMYNKKTMSLELITEENKQYYKGSQEKAKKLIAQNKVLNLYSDILQSPHTYDNMMTSIDSEFLKEDIMDLFPQPALKNLDLFSPVTQIQTKMNYMSGKMGVGLTANQLVDHVSNQSLKISVNADLGFGEAILKEGTKDRYYTEMDKKKSGRSIATTLSAFLNAYVDIAKDPYVTRGNHNDITANVSFMLIRAGASLEKLNRFIGQPILKELVELKKKSESITSDPLYYLDSSGKKVLATPYEYLRNKYGIANVENSQKQLRKISNKQLFDRIKGSENKFIDSVVLNSFEFLEKKANQWTDAVIASKIDVKGAGGSPIEMLIAKNKINKIQKDNFVNNYMTKFDGTSMGTYNKEALDFTSSVLNKSEILLSATEGMIDLLNQASSDITSERYLVSKKLGTAIAKGAYTYMMSGTGLMKSNRLKHKELFVDLPNKIYALKNQKGLDNFLIKELEINMFGGYNFIGINAKDKPAQYQNDIYRAWMSLYEDSSTKEVAVDLVRYAYSQSGFQQNLNEFFSHIPHEILRDEGLNSESSAFFQKISNLKAGKSTFLDQFFRHNSGNRDVVPRINENEIRPTEGVNKELAFVAEDNFVEKYSATQLGLKTYNPPEFVTLAIGENKDIALYEKRRSIIFGEEIDNPVYVRTHKLGAKKGKNKIFEYSYEEEIKSSILDENQINKIEAEKSFEKILNEYGQYIDERETDYLPSLEEKVQESENNHREVVEIDNADYQEEGPSFKITPEMLKNIIEKENIEQKNCNKKS